MAIKEQGKLSGKDDHKLQNTTPRDVAHASGTKDRPKAGCDCYGICSSKDFSAGIHLPPQAL